MAGEGWLAAGAGYPRDDEGWAAMEADERRYALAGVTVKELRAACRRAGARGYSSLSRDGLMALLAERARGELDAVAEERARPWRWKIVRRAGGTYQAAEAAEERLGVQVLPGGERGRYASWADARAVADAMMGDILSCELRLTGARDALDAVVSTLSAGGWECAAPREYDRDDGRRAFYLDVRRSR